MATLNKISALETMRRLLPLTNLFVYDNEIRYRFKREASAKHFEMIAIDQILRNGLPLVTCVEIWRKYGVVFEVNLVISMAPEETIAS